MNLETPIGQLPLVGPIYIKRLKKLEIKTVGDLLFHVPHRYLDFRLVSEIGRAQLGETVTIRGEVLSIKNIYSKGGRKMQIAEIKDASGQIEAVWFNQPFLIRTLSVGTRVALAGRIDWFGRKRALISPEYEKLSPGRTGVHTGRLTPIYPETAGVSSKWLRSRIDYAFSRTKQNIEEYLPSFTLRKLALPGLTDALEAVHFPKSLKEAQKGRERLSFDELLFIQLRSIYRKLAWQKNKAAHQLAVKRKQVVKLIKSLPFKLTSSQKRSLEEILSDLEKETPMNRLLEGDVGSGKTVVAAVAAFVSFLNGKQTVFMAPTQILAEQHFNTLKKLLSSKKVRIKLITGGLTKADLGRPDIYIGTHALIHRKVNFENIALVVIDEQHRFGVEQRSHLIRKSGEKLYAPHVLTMTATPIPRTIALTVYGDLDLSTLEELPAGRRPIKTWLVPPQKRERAYRWIEEQIKKNRIQVFVICPLIEESEKETMKQVRAASAEFQNIKRIFPKRSIGLLHGKQKSEEKSKTLKAFKAGKIDILVATPVVEVGIDVPNAAIMIIETAERFGLAQLHQLRGRIGRGKKESYCLLFTEKESKRASIRLSALQKTLSGFELAEMDLKLRGPGEILGTRQHGFPELKIASWQDEQLIKKAKKTAGEAIENPKKFSRLLKKLKAADVTPN